MLIRRGKGKGWMAGWKADNQIIPYREDNPNLLFPLPFQVIL